MGTYGSVGGASSNGCVYLTSWDTYKDGDLVRHERLIVIGKNETQFSSIVEYFYHRLKL